ncbi:hypothetical protein B0H14DRAFT_2578182 [Mycena olivaceomarginata]|nr:hypothetical protein B0H14DRAFT_2578182 [Mycena olivaceomarginata]
MPTFPLSHFPQSESNVGTSGNAIDRWREISDALQRREENPRGTSFYRLESHRAACEKQIAKQPETEVMKFRSFENKLGNRLEIRQHSLRSNLLPAPGEIPGESTPRARPSTPINDQNSDHVPREPTLGAGTQELSSEFPQALKNGQEKGLEPNLLLALTPHTAKQNAKRAAEKHIRMKNRAQNSARARLHVSTAEKPATEPPEDSAAQPT